MKNIYVETVDDSIERASVLLSRIPNGLRTVITRALNRSLYEGRTSAIREVRKEYTVRARDVRPTFKMHRANKKDLNAELKSRGSNLELTLFSHKPKTDTTGARRRQIRVGVKKGGLKPIGQGFIHKGRIFQRLGETSYPVQLKFGIAVPVMLNNDDVSGEVLDTMRASFVKRLDHETDILLSGVVKTND